MIDWVLIQKLMKCFPNSIINSNMEFIAHVHANEYFRLEDCDTALDIECKVLEWFSMGAYKKQPFGTEQKNLEFQKFMCDGINNFLGTAFTKEDMEKIYTYLGNRCNHAKTVEFVCSNYNFSLLYSCENAGPAIEQEEAELA